MVSPRSLFGACGTLALALGLAACIPDLDISGKPCPCAPGFHCDEDRCVPGEAPPDAGQDAGPAVHDSGTETEDAGPGDAGPPEGRIQVHDLHAEWRTPNSIQWSWSVVGDPAEFGELILVVAENEDDLASETGTARVIDGSERPSLRLWNRRRTCGGDDQILSVYTDRHTPSTRYVAQLIAIDNRGHRSRSNVAPVTTTPAPIGAVVLFSDERPRGYPLPGEITVSSEAPYRTANHLLYAHDSCPPPSPECPQPPGFCYQNVRWQDMRAGALPISGGSFELAYLEMAVAIDAPEPSYWSSIGLHLREGTSFEVWKIEPFVLRTGTTYDLIQVPLHALTRSDMGLDFARASTLELDGFRVGGSFPVGTRVRVDEVAIRW
ncbi:MAG: hypothetical protein VYE22_34565 [Myxococcota bacterium]|nr:hypothetical protein [Myxococcota bacterium]